MEAGVSNSFFLGGVAFKAMWAEPRTIQNPLELAQEAHHFLALIFKPGHYWGLVCGIVPLQTFPTHNVIQKGSPPGLEINFKQG